MKKFLLSALAAVSLAASFPSHNSPPGWYQVPLPVNDLITDIFFIDTLNGWITTQGTIAKGNDTAYIFKTTDGGDNWIVQFTEVKPLRKIIFFDVNTGYIGSGTNSGYGSLLKTTNGGANWVEDTSFMQGIGGVVDMSFLNKDTGWVCDPTSSFGGLIKTTNGGINWIRQTIPNDRTRFVTFPSYDTGYYATNNGYLYKTTTSGNNWTQILHPSFISGIFFLNNQKGWLYARITPQGRSVARTTNGGLNWTENTEGLYAGPDMYFINDTVGYSGGGEVFEKITKTTDGGKIWGYQSNPIPKVKQVWALKNNPDYAWVGDTKFAKTNDGGGTIIFTDIKQINSSVPTIYKLSQNYPNPFNPTTKIKFDVRESSDIKFIIYDIRGKVIQDNRYGTVQPGEYEMSFDANAFALTSGVYFYKLIATNKKSNVFSETKKMLLVK